jgi:hypothetical protein
MNWKTTICLVVEKQSRTFLTDCRIRQRLVEFDNVFLNLANKKYLDSKKVLKCREWDLISPTMAYKDRLRPLNLHKYMSSSKNFNFVNKPIVRTSMRPVIFQWKSIHFTLKRTQNRPIKRIISEYIDLNWAKCTTRPYSWNWMNVFIALMTTLHCNAKVIIGQIQIESTKLKVQLAGNKNKLKVWISRRHFLKFELEFW